MPKVNLTAAERAMGLRELMQKYHISKATAHRAKQRGWFNQNHHNSTAAQREKQNTLAALPPAPRLAPGKSHTLSALERSLPIEQLMKRFRVGEAVAKRAKETGVLSYQRKVYAPPPIPSPPEWTRALPKHYDPTHPKFRVNLAPAEFGLRLADLVVLYAAFGLSSEMASKARKRGYFCPNGGKIVEPCVDAAAFAAIEESVLEECRQGARRALRKFFGDSWHTKLRAYTFDDVAAAAVEHLRNRSGRPEFSAVRWRVVCAYFGALNFISKQAKRAVRETTTVDELEGRFGEQ